MRNRVLALRELRNGGVDLFPTEWDDADQLHCQARGRDIIAPAGHADPVGTIAKQLAAFGIDAVGCFNCRYFLRTGMQEEAGGTVGYCLEGKLGKRLEIPRDITTAESSCDAFEPDANGSRATVLAAWKASVGK